MAENEFELAGCLVRVREGDDAAASELVGHLWPLVIKIVRSHLPRRTDEADLAQDVFIKLFTRLSQYQARDGKPFEHWVSRVAVTTCLDSLRAEKRRPEWRWADLSEDEAKWLEYMTGDEVVEQPGEDLAVRELVTRMMQQLPADDRLVINWMDLEGKTVAEISRLSGWSESNVKVKAFRARKKLKAIAETMRKEGRL